MKGILIYLVIVGHVIAKYAEPGWAYTVIHTFHMPLFFFISGYLAIPSFRQTFKDFTGKKYRRILRPALCWSLLFFLLKLPSHLDFVFTTEIWGERSRDQRLLPRMNESMLMLAWTANRAQRVAT